MKAKQFFLIIGFVFLNISYSYGQYQTVEQYIYFKSKMDSPIAIDVINQDDKYIFYADNRSFYSYQIQIHFDQLFNLIPELVNRDFEVLPGRSCLFTLSVKNKEMKSTFAYSFSSKIGIPRGNADFEFPYLFPIGDGKPVELFYYLSDSIIYIRDCFKLNEGDTVFNMRKGDVVAVPNMFHNADRISDSQSLEIMHKDGTIMVYENINPDNVLVNAGATVYPGQPLGIVNDGLHLMVFLCSIHNDGRVEKMKIKYFITPSRIELFSKAFNDLNASHPVNIVTKEMSKREIRRYFKSSKKTTADL
jgi:hypothetical protein